MAACTIFDEDEVCIPASSGGFKYGLVVESSEYISSDEDDDEYENKVQKGTVKVAWHPSGDENVVVENTLILADRSLMPGDVVRRLISEKDSQRGFVESISAKCHVKILGTDQWIYNVDVSDIATLQEWDTESEVTLDSWVGQLYEIREDVTVKFPDGARCILKDAGMLDLEDTNDKRSDVRTGCEHSEFVIRSFYPGQELVGSQEDYESAEWLHTTRMRGPDALGAKPLYQVPVIVEKVEVSGVDVRWLCKGFTRAGSEKDALDSPPRHVEGDQLKRLKVMDCFKHCHHQIGDKGYYIVKETDTVLKGMSPRQHYTPDVIQKLTSDNNITIIGTRKDGFVIAKKEAKKLSEASNGPVENGVETNAGAESQIVDNNVDDNDGDDESEDVDDDDDEDGNEEDRNNSANNGSHGSPAVRNRNRKRAFLKSGKSLKKLRGRLPKKKLKLPERVLNPGDKVPIEIFYTFSSCRVMWQDGTAEDDIPSPELFPIHHLDEFEYFPGDFVVDAKGSTSTDYGVIVSCDHKERTCMVRWMKPYFAGKSQRPEEGETTEMSVYDIKDHPDYKFRPGNTVIRVGGFEEANKELEAVGQVYRLDSDGSVHIWWPNNTITKTYPQDLFLITDDMSGVNSSDDWSDDGEEEESEAESDVSWETEGEESTDAETDSEDKGEETKSQSKPIWTCDDSKKKDLDELLGRLQTAISGLLDIFQNVSGPFFKNSKQVFQDILEIFKKCKEMEKLTKSSFFKADGICELMAEIKEELRKENTTKLAKHVASMYKYRNSPQYSEITSKAENSNRKRDERMSTIKESDEMKVANGDCDLMTSDETKFTGADATLPDKTEAGIERNEPGKDQNDKENTQNIVTNAETSAQEKDKDVETETLEGAVGRAGDTEKQNETTEQKIKQALIDYGSHIEDPILQIIFDTSLQLAVAKSAKKQTEATSAAGDSVNKSECQETGYNDHNTGAKDVKPYKSDNDNDIIDSVSINDAINNAIESTLISLSSGDQDAEVAALKNSAKRKVEEICSQARDESIGTQTSERADASIQTAIVIDANGEPSVEQSSQKKEADIAQSISRVESQDVAEADKDKTLESSGNKPEFPTNHRTLCIQICKALSTQLTRMQQELHRKWLTYKFGCDKNATDFELYEAIQGKLIESHEENGRPLSLSDLPGGEKETDTDVKTNIEDSKASKLDGESVQVLEGSGQSDKSEEVSEDTEGASADIENENQQKEQSSGFELCSSVSSSHWFKFQEQKPNNIKSFITAVRKELMLLQTSLPQGILVKAFEDRMDLFAVMIYGPAKTPYEDGLFSFDVQLPANFPQSPPMFHYLSYCNERLNPNLYEDGKVCVSLLGTWSGKGSEMWTAKSSLLQVLVSIQGLILVSEPYFNEAGYEKQRGTQQGQENSRMYNEMAVLKLVQSMTKMALTPPAMFAEETREHLYKTVSRMIKRLESWIDLSINHRCTPGEGNQNTETGTSQESHDHQPQSHDHHPESPEQSCDSGETDTESGVTLPDFPLLPASKGFCLTLKKYLDNFKNVLNEHIWTKDIPDH